MLDMQRQHNHPNISRLHFAVAERQCGNPIQYRLSPPKSNPPLLSYACFGFNLSLWDVPRGMIIMCQVCTD